VEVHPLHGGEIRVASHEGDVQETVEKEVRGQRSPQGPQGYRYDCCQGNFNLILLDVRGISYKVYQGFRLNISEEASCLHLSHF